MELSHVGEWLKANKISLNIDKTKYMLFSCTHCESSIPIKIFDRHVNRTNTIKFLGIYLDERLNFTEHTNYISGKLSKTVGIF